MPKNRDAEEVVQISKKYFKAEILCFINILRIYNYLLNPAGEKAKDPKRYKPALKPRPNKV